MARLTTRINGSHAHLVATMTGCTRLELGRAG